MLECPYCKQKIDDDSLFCDQCGKELFYCPSCKKLQRGSECNICGEDLVSAKVFCTNEASSPSDEKGTTAATDTVTKLQGNGWELILKEGAFGRNGGVFPEFSSVIYISGNHGQIRKGADGWEISDSGSTNGTFINGTKLEVNKWYKIHKDDIIKIATISFKII